MNTHRSPIIFEPADVFTNLVSMPPDWIWDEQLALGCLTLLIGNPKAGKSLFARNLIGAVLNGNPFLGKNTKQVVVAYLALEDHPSFLKQSLKQAGLDKQHLHIHHGSMFGTQQELIDCLKNYVIENEVKFVVIDPMAKFTSISDLNDYTIVYRELSRLVTLARELNIHILLVHHSNKGGSDNPNQIMGSNAVFGVSDGAFILSRSGNQGSIKSYLRYGSGIENCSFSYDENKNLIFQGTEREFKVQALKIRILSYLAEFPKSDAIQISKSLGVAKETILKVLFEMEAEGTIDKTGDGVKGNKFVYSVSALETLEREQNNEVVI